MYYRINGKIMDKNIKENFAPRQLNNINNSILEFDCKYVNAISTFLLLVSIFYIFYLNRKK